MAVTQIWTLYVVLG